MAPGAVISVGLEVHARLRMPTKLFCGCPNRYGDPPNTLVCPVCLGMPGSLPLLQPPAAELGWRIATALGCCVSGVSAFARKNYFYPDLPRNYQITQYDHPLATGGRLEAAGQSVRLRRIHLEEDAGRLVSGPDGLTGVDLNRAGTPLVEIVTEPDLTDGAGAAAWLRRLRQVLLYLDASDGRMAEGSLRCDANLGRPGGEVLVELKNLNSFRAVQRAVDQEADRLAVALAAGQEPPAETRSWDEDSGRTRRLRTKESAADYRYFAEPDLPPPTLPALRDRKSAAVVPPLPWEREVALVREWGLDPALVEIICRLPERADYFEAVARDLGGAAPETGALVAAWVTGQVLQEGVRETRSGEEYLVPADVLGELLDLLRGGRITAPTAKMLFGRLAAGEERRPVEILEAENLVSLDDPAELERLCRAILETHPDEDAAWRAGRDRLVDFFVGRVMAASRGRAQPVLVREMLDRLRHEDA